MRHTNLFLTVLIMLAAARGAASEGSDTASQQGELDAQLAQIVHEIQTNNLVDVSAFPTALTDPSVVRTPEEPMMVDPEIAAMTVEESYGFYWPMIKERLFTTDLSADMNCQIGVFIDVLRDEDIDYIWWQHLVPDLRVATEFDAQLKAMTVQQRNEYLRDVLENIGRSLLRDYDADGDGSLTYAELRDFTMEVIPLSYRAGALSFRTTIQRYLVGLRYADFDGDGRLLDIERTVVEALTREIRLSNGDFSKTFQYLENLKERLLAQGINITQPPPE